MEEAGLHDIKTYVTRHQNTVMQYIETNTIMDLCLAAGWRTGGLVLKRWWEQENLDLEGIRKAARVAEAERD